MYHILTTSLAKQIKFCDILRDMIWFLKTLWALLLWSCVLCSCTTYFRLQYASHMNRIEPIQRKFVKFVMWQFPAPVTSNSKLNFQYLWLFIFFGRRKYLPLGFIFKPLNNLIDALSNYRIFIFQSMICEDFRSLIHSILKACISCTLQWILFFVFIINIVM